MPAPGTRENLVHPQLFAFSFLFFPSVFIAYLWWFILCVDLAEISRPDMWLNVILDVSETVSFGRYWHLKILTFKFVPFESSGLSSIHGWATSNWLKAWRDQKEWLPLRKGQFYQQITFGHELQHQFSFSLLAYIANFRHVCASRHTHACISSIVIAELIIDSVSLENPD